ncbi:TPA: hypothetical protein U2B45_001927 [Streptococcus suis]|nr:hypothetical protein [Streptococcus suis]
MEAQSLGSHQHSWWFSFVFLYEKNWLEAITKKTNGFTPNVIKLTNLSRFVVG